MNRLMKVYFDQFIESAVVLGCRVHASEGKYAVIDAGVNCPGGWAAGKNIHKMLMDGLGDVNFDNIKVANENLPAVVIYFDNPSLVYENYLDPKGEFRYQTAETMNEERSGTIIAKASSITDYIVQAGTLLPKVTKYLIENDVDSKDILWGFSCAPLIIKQQTVEGCKKDKDAMDQYTVVSLWIHSSDENLVRFAREMNFPGEIRLHNLKTGNTFISGCTDDGALIHYIKN